MNDRAAYGWMLCGAVCFTLMGAATHHLGQFCPWQIVAAARTAIALILSIAMAKSRGITLVFFRPAALWMRSIAGSISLLCTFFALTRLPIAEVLTLTNMFPIWVAVLSWPLLREIPNGNTWLAVLTGVSGVVLIQWPYWTANNDDQHFAALLAALSSFTTAIAMIGLHRLKSIDSMAIVVHFSAIGLGACLLSFLWSSFEAPSSLLWNPSQLGILLSVGVFATAGQFCLTRAFTLGNPANVAVIGLTQVVFGFGFDILVWHRDFQLITLAGVMLVLGPTAWLLTKRR